MNVRRGGIGDNINPEIRARLGGVSLRGCERSPLSFEPQSFHFRFLSFNPWLISPVPISHLPILCFHKDNALWRRIQQAANPANILEGHTSKGNARLQRDKERGKQLHELIVQIEYHGPLRSTKRRQCAYVQRLDRCSSRQGRIFRPLHAGS